MTAVFTGKSDIYGRKYCSGCRMHQDLEGGGYKQTKSTPRWLCVHCIKRSSTSGFSLKGKLKHDNSSKQNV